MEGGGVEPSNRSEGSSRPRRRRRTRALWVAALGLLLALRVASVFTANVHWDEFALLNLADLTHSSGRLEAAGRPGLAVALLQPFVAHCDDEISVIRRARLLWLLFSSALLVGLGVWIAQLAPDPRSRWRDAALGVALLAVVPAFLESSLQVRTDQLALAGGIWGGAALLASRRRPGLALLAGAGFGAGLLGSQKVLYVGALAALLALGQLALAHELRPRREALRAAGLAVGLAAVVAAFQGWAGLAFAVAPASPVRAPITRDYVAHGFSLFEYYRHSIGWSEYRAMLPSLLPHALLLLALAAASALAWRRRSGELGLLALAWCVLGLGLAVALFHAAAFRYFWMTLGLFPALAFAVSRGSLERLVPAPLRGRLVLGFWLVLLLPGALQLVYQLSDGQRVQRESLGFVHRNFDRSVVGFHPESGLFCQAGAQPLPTFFSQHIYRRFAGAGRERHTAELMATFRDTPVEFLVQSFRLNQFPVELRRFWAAHYQPYRASVFVAGQHLEGARGERAELDLLVPGRYRWLPFAGPQALAIEDRLVGAGEVVELGRGVHVARFVEDVPGGMLVLALEEPPGEAPLPFYR